MTRRWQDPLSARILAWFNCNSLQKCPVQSIKPIKQKEHRKTGPKTYSNYIRCLSSGSMLGRSISGSCVFQHVHLFETNPSAAVSFWPLGGPKRNVKESCVETRACSTTESTLTNLKYLQIKRSNCVIKSGSFQTLTSFDQKRYGRATTKHT